MSPELVLFDIDGTLVRKTGLWHRQAICEAVRVVFGITATTEGIPVHGMLDPDILTLMLLAANVEEAEITARMPALVAAAEDYYLSVTPELPDCHCPGVPALLDSLAERGTVVGLVTGNVTRIGWRKLERAGLGGRFRFGAFGEMAATRGGLAKLAIARARQEGWIEPDAKISLIGDAPQDIRAAQENGIQSIAVRTGVTPEGHLEACQPDFLLPDLTHLDLAILRR
ncbi:MAG: Haloacid dehalogenase domain protein hydrolase [Bryobacterales bacterium]|nr:Haloacid dehalogenase domain protein hydrolase [Bryobacterales bacterium]